MSVYVHNPGHSLGSLGNLYINCGHNLFSWEHHLSLFFLIVIPQLSTFLLYIDQLYNSLYRMLYKRDKNYKKLAFNKFFNKKNLNFNFFPESLPMGKRLDFTSKVFSNPRIFPSHLFIWFLPPLNLGDQENKKLARMSLISLLRFARNRQ